MKKAILFLLAAPILLYVIAAASLFFLQRNFLYFPTPAVAHEGAEAFYLEHDGLQLKIWKIANGKDRAVIYFGGNAENVARNINDFQDVLPGYDIFLANYRGYGGSEGEPTEDGLYADALALYDHVKNDYADISIIGRSLGSGVATYVAANRPVEQLALITPYDSVESVAEKKFPIFPVSFLLKDKYESVITSELWLDKFTSVTLMLLARIMTASFPETSIYQYRKPNWRLLKLKNFRNKFIKRDRRDSKLRTDHLQLSFQISGILDSLA